MNNSKTSVTLTFCGAARTVTGSKYLVEVSDKKILIDCGLFQGRKECRLRNWDEPPFDPKELSAVILTHAHVDHTGYLPRLVRAGFKGPVYCTAATKDLLYLLLPDSAHLQEEEARFANKHKTSKHDPALPLYTAVDAANALKLLKVIERDKANELFPEITVTPTCAGHILGSTSLALDCFGKRINFSGDIGRYDTPILPDPQPIEMGDLLLCESTYGNRLHAAGDMKQELAEILNQAAATDGPIVIPAFSIGRTQVLLYYIAELEREGRIPEIPVFVDSPMAVDATRIYRNFRHDFDDAAAAILAKGESCLLTSIIKFCKDVEDSKRLNTLKGRSRIIISASGMVTGGRILHHMRHWLPHEETTVIFVGYQAEGTRGQAILAGAEKIKIFGEQIPVRAQIHNISGLSAHADYNELIRWLEKSAEKGEPKAVKIIHGEDDAAGAFAERLRDKFNWNTSVAGYLESIEI